MRVPFFCPDVSEAEIERVANVLRSGWLTSGPQAREFEERFASAVGARFALSVNSCTAALHLALEALQLQPGEAVLVPTMTFAATAEVVRYLGAIPILVDCDPVTMNLDLDDAERKLAALDAGSLPVGKVTRVAGVIPVHVGGLLMDMKRTSEWAGSRGLWVVEDAAHAFPAAARPDSESEWVRCGGGTADVSCFSFYANKTITTGEGGLATTENEELADRMRLMALHGLSNGAWDRFKVGAAWDYRIVAPGFKYNLSDAAAALGLGQLERAEAMRLSRAAVAARYADLLAGVEAIELPPCPENRVHSWHLCPIRLRLARLTINRDAFIEELTEAGIGTSVHWRPLHLHPYYQEAFGWDAADFPVATAEWERLVSLPIFTTMTEAQITYVCDVIADACQRHARS